MGEDFQFNWAGMNTPQAAGWTQADEAELQSLKGQLASLQSQLGNLGDEKSDAAAADALDNMLAANMLRAGDTGAAQYFLGRPENRKAREQSRMEQNYWKLQDIENSISKLATQRTWANDNLAEQQLLDTQIAGLVSKANMLRAQMGLEPMAMPSFKTPNVPTGPAAYPQTPAVTGTRDNARAIYNSSVVKDAAGKARFKKGTKDKVLDAFRGLDLKEDPELAQIYAGAQDMFEEGQMSPEDITKWLNDKANRDAEGFYTDAQINDVQGWFNALPERMRTAELSNAIKKMDTRAKAEARWQKAVNAGAAEFSRSMKDGAMKAQAEHNKTFKGENGKTYKWKKKFGIEGWVEEK